MVAISSSDRRCVNLVICAMRSDKTNVDEAELILNRHNQSILIALDIEDHAIIAYDAGIAINSFNICRTFPLGLFGIVIPRLQRRLAVRVSFPKVAECLQGNGAHN